MYNGSKRIWVILAVIVIVVVSLVIIFSKSGEKKEEVGTTEKVETLEINQVMEIDDIEKSQYKTEKKQNVQVATKYIVGNENYELKANVKFEEIKGKMIYIRGEQEKLNIYQTEYKLDKYEDTNMQIEEILRDFEEMCRSYINLKPDDKAKSETLYGESIQKVEIPLSESIYLDNRLYSKTYEKDGKTYDMNIYRNGEKINCELVYRVK